MLLSNIIPVILLPATLLAASLQLVIPSTAILSNPSTLPPSTHATLTTSNLIYDAPLRRTNTFVFSNISAGSYLLDIHCRDYVFAPYRVDVIGEDVEVWQTWRGNEWDNKGEMIGKGRVDVKVVAKREFYEGREGFSPLSLLKNPMILMAIVGLGLVVGMPYLLDNMDPEMKKEFEEHQKKGSLSSAVAGGNPLQSFDMAAWMAGKTASTSQREDDGGKKARKRA